ncbi:phosphoribosylamine--glycine ligase [Bacteroidia bacterium]|nr:phosphoribosylamine--glycine ligase [Bacteroidia bacterium]
MNDLRLRSIPVIGPQREAAQLEGSKAFAKAFMQRHHIPTASYAVFNKTQIDEAKRYLLTLTPPYVLKADGLSAGKGVVILNTVSEAYAELDEMLAHSKFGKASDTVVIEQFLTGIELSVFVLTDGHSYKILPSAKDYKRVGDHDTGLNTGGMGAVSPVPFASEAFMNKVEQRIVRPTIDGLQTDGIPYQGFLFIGLMDVNDEPYVIEYNVRLGDPETEAILPRIQSDLLQLFKSVVTQQLHTETLQIDPRYAVCVMLTAAGYPEHYEKGYRLHFAEASSDALIFHAGTKQMADDQLCSNGGRVVAITTLGNTLQEAIDTTYQQVKTVDFEGRYHRTDIGYDLLPYTK